MRPRTERPSRFPAAFRATARSLVAALCLAAFPAAGLSAQASGQGSSSSEASATAQDTAGVVYRREIFSYPAQGRRDPLSPVRGGEDVGPRFEDLKLSGIIYNPSVGSVVVLVDTNLDKRYRVREGERLGEVRVLEIRPSEVEFSISGTFGQARREVLRVKKEEEEQQG